MPFVNGHGDVTWVRTMGAPQQEGGEVAALRGVIQDITKLTERKRQYETLVENLPGIVYRAQVHPEWPFELLDGECEALTGYSAEELFSLNWGSKIIHPADQQPIYNAVTSTLEDHETFEVTYRIQTKTGEIKWVWERGREIEPGILEGFITDITDRVDYERDLERYQTIVEASGDGMYSLDADGHLTLVNDSFTEIVGYSEEELLGEHIGLVMTPEDVEQGEEIIRSLLGSDSVHGMFEMDLVRADGERIPCENHLVLLPFEETFRGTAGVLRDISERREREQKLERQRDRLEEFASVISHDLRNPLTVAQGYLDMARNQGDEESFELIDTSLDRMERIIQDVLWLSREGRDIGETEAVDLSMAVDEAWRIVTAGSEEPTLITDPADLGTIQADSDRLGQLLENLFRNSVEHVGPDVTVTVTATDSGFAVEDDGEGIPAAIRDRVFERGITSNEDGTGLGLYIAHDIASAHGWSVTLIEGEGGGARFEFEIQPESE
ncbi:MAG: PAS domain S-box protein [Natrialbaceae archaeon]|nr:PAS domain S-box protein [Natrialbaceae archaeon]